MLHFYKRGDGLKLRVPYYGVAPLWTRCDDFGPSVS